MMIAELKMKYAERDWGTAILAVGRQASCLPICLFQRSAGRVPAGPTDWKPALRLVGAFFNRRLSFSAPKS